MFFTKWLDGPEKKLWVIILISIILIIGSVKLLIWILSPLFTCFRQCCRCRQNLLKKYGKEDGSAYAVVTGGSDGIGLELCH